MHPENSHRKRVLTFSAIVILILSAYISAAQRYDTINLDGQPISNDLIDNETGLINLQVIRNNNENVEVFVPAEFRLMKSSKPASAIVEVTSTFLWVFESRLGYVYVFENVSTLDLVVGGNKPYADNTEL